MVLTLYYDILAPSARAIRHLLEVNNIEHNVVDVCIMKGEHKQEAFRKINPNCKLPFIDHDGFKFGESVAIMMYIATAFGVPETWYPTDVKQRALIDEALAWQHTSQYSLRHFGIEMYHNKLSDPIAFGYPFSKRRFEKDVAGLHDAISFMENYFLRDTPFMNSSNVTIADLLAICEISEVAPLVDVFESHQKMKQWSERVKSIIGVRWDEVHKKFCDDSAKLAEDNKELLASLVCQE